MCLGSKHAFSATFCGVPRRLQTRVCGLEDWVGGEHWAVDRSVGSLEHRNCFWLVHGRLHGKQVFYVRTCPGRLYVRPHQKFEPESVHRRPQKLHWKDLRHRHLNGHSPRLCSQRWSSARLAGLVQGGAWSRWRQHRLQNNWLRPKMFPRLTPQTASWPVAFHKEGFLRH